MKVILNAEQIGLMLQRLACQMAEDHESLDKLVVIGVQPRGVWLSDRLVTELEKLLNRKITYGKLDITFYRDDFRREILVPSETDLNMSLENKEVILVDDVLYTGRTTRAALDALLAHGRPSRVSLCVLIDRRFNREIPIQPDYSGQAIDTIFSQKVKVMWQEQDGKDEVVLFDKNS